MPALSATYSEKQAGGAKLEREHEVLSPRGVEAPDGPPSPEQVFGWVESGRVGPVEAVRHLRRLSRDTPPLHRPAADSRSSPDQLDALQAELAELVGLREVKRHVREICAYVEIRRRRAAQDLLAPPQTLHMVFTGSPGTGKTTVARLLGSLLRELGILQKGHVVEVERADLVGEYIGHTAHKTRDVVRRALGGLLFIDEAYSLARGGEKDFGKEAIDVLVKAMEDHKSDFVVILAGYPNEMAGFIGSNPGLLSRFPIHLQFPDYSHRELMQIGQLMVQERQYRLTEEAQEKLLRFLEQHESGWHPHAGNARLVRNLVERAIRRQAVRLVQRGGNPTRDDLMTLVWTDFEEVR